MQLLLSGGPVLGLIILVSIIGLYLFIERSLYLSRERTNSDALMRDVASAIDVRNIDHALEVCQQYGGSVARVLEYALSRLPYGKAAVEAAFEEASLEEEQQLMRGMRTLASIPQIATLLGLLGTVIGMIIAFNEIAARGTGDPSRLASGIGQALLTTAAGLIVAIPTLIGHTILVGRAEALLAELERRREEFMGRVAQVVSVQRKQKYESRSSEPILVRESNDEAFEAQ